MRSVPLWRSDTGCSPGHADWNQTQICGLSLYLPLFGACAWTPEAYDVRSAATAGLICQFGVLDADFPLEQARAAVAEAKENQKYWYGDFYPLTPCTPGPGAFMACQFHRSDLDAGMALAFRRSECPFPVLQSGLWGLNPKATYAVEFIERGSGQGAAEDDRPGSYVQPGTAPAETRQQPADAISPALRRRVRMPPSDC